MDFKDVKGSLEQDTTRKSVYKDKFSPLITSKFGIAPYEHQQWGLQLFFCQNSFLEKYKCTKCNFATHLATALNQHLQEFHLKAESEKVGIQSYTCRNCSFQTHFRLSWLKHTLSNCLLSNKVRRKKRPNSKTKPHLSKQIETKHPLKLNLAKLKTTLTLKMKGAPQKHLADYECDKCDHKVFTKHELQVHIIQKHLKADELKWFQCDKCGYRSKKKVNLKEHYMRKHSERDEAKLLHCETCNHKVRSNSELKVHRIRKHLPDDEIQWLECENCDYRAKTKSDIKIHTKRKHQVTDSPIIEEKPVFRPIFNDRGKILINDIISATISEYIS